jgi:hypothetical protein
LARRPSSWHFRGSSDLTEVAPKSGDTPSIRMLPVPVYYTKCASFDTNSNSTNTAQQHSTFNFVYLQVRRHFLQVVRQDTHRFTVPSSTSANASSELPFNETFTTNTVQSAGIAWAETTLNMTYAFSITSQDGKSYIVPTPRSLSKTGITHYFTDVAVLNPSCSFPQSNITSTVNIATVGLSVTALPIGFPNGMTITITPATTFG